VEERERLTASPNTPPNEAAEKVLADLGESTRLGSFSFSMPGSDGFFLPWPLA
jgi:hypothetical protein